MSLAPINWFPGHMHKATKEIKKLLSEIDIIIEVLDARIPYSSQNPAIAALDVKKDKSIPRIKLLNKCDLADAAITEQWVASFEMDDSVKTLTLSQTQDFAKGESAKHNIRQQITDLCYKLVPKKAKQEVSVRRIKAIIVGAPNVGKSTIMNHLVGKKVAKTGNEAAVTKCQQRYQLTDDITLFDTPGILWPKFYNQNTAYRLAVTGAIKPTAFEFDDAGFFLIEYLLQAYPDALKERFSLNELPSNDIEFFDIVGQKRRCFSSANFVDYTRLGEAFVMEYRQLQFGRMSLETPEMAEKEQALAELAMQEHEDKKAAQKDKKHGKKRKTKR